MADEEPAAGHDPSWWTFDAPDDAPLPPSTFGDPVAWPDISEWDAPPPAAGGPEVPAAGPVEPDFDLSALDVPPGVDAGPVDDLQSLPESLWSDDRPDDTALSAPPTASAFYAEQDGGGSQTRPGRFGFVRKNGALSGLAAFVGLVLLAVFISVRNDPDVKPTTASQATPTVGRISTEGQTRTLLPTTTTVAGPPPGIALTDLLLPGQDASAGGATPQPGTVSPGRVPVPAGQTGSQAPAPTSGTATPAPSDTGTTTTVPQTPTSTTPVDSTTPVNTTRPTAPPTSFTIPSFTVPTGPTSPTTPRPTPRR